MRAAHPGDVLPARLELRRAPRAASQVRAAALWAVLACLALPVSVLAHLAMPVGRAAAADLAEGLLNSRIRGVAHIGAITRLDFDGVEMRDLSVVSPAGERVISADRMTAEFAFIESLRRGAIVLTPCELEGGEMRVTRGPRDQIALVSAMEVPSDRFAIPIELDDIRLLRQTMIFGLPGVPGELEMSEVYGLVDMTLGHTFEARMDQVHGYVNFPIVHVGFERLSGRLRSDDLRPLVIRMVLDLEVAQPSLEMTYTAPGALGREGGGNLGLELGVDVPDPS